MGNGTYFLIHGTSTGVQELDRNVHALKCLSIVNKESSHLCLPISSQYPARTTKSTKQIQIPKEHSRQHFCSGLASYLAAGMEL